MFQNTKLNEEYVKSLEPFWEQQISKGWVMGCPTCKKTIEKNKKVFTGENPLAKDRIVEVYCSRFCMLARKLRGMHD
jgi:hypothetical protein